MAKRRWGSWLRRISHELNAVSGVAGLGGVAVGASGVTFLSGVAATVITSAGGVIVLAALGYAAVRSFPPLVRQPADLVGQVIDIADLEAIEPKIPTLSIIGPTKAGKTTLRSRLAFEFSPNTRTQRISAFVVPLQVSPPKYLAILDGGGEVYAQQFKLAEVCDRLCIVLDHNISDSDAQIDQSRLAEQAKFLAQIRHHLDEYRAKPKQWIHLLMNKRDLWETLDNAQSDLLDQFCHEETEKWRQARHAESIGSARHSNNKPDDISGFVAILKK